MNIKRLSEIDSRMDAFTLRDLQHLAVLVAWGRQCQFSLEELIAYLSVAPTFRQLITVGFSQATHSIQQLKIIKSLEQALPRELRKEFRRIRLNNARFGTEGG
jgi:hypothetical protein